MADYLVNSEEANKWVPEYRTVYDETEIPAERVGGLVVFLASGKVELLTGRFLDVYDDIQDSRGAESPGFEPWGGSAASFLAFLKHLC
ncbi:MAG TPA: hypothetical protein VHZ51_02405 [Ktedonobacteraceae bacterium]|nr:hypothetical protein [Ktedonobacteraceae bacterium]